MTPEFDPHRPAEHCFWCGQAMGRGTLRPVTRDHVVPRSRGGRHNWNNLVWSCHLCNLQKGDQLPQEWARSDKLLRGYHYGGAYPRHVVDHIIMRCAEFPGVVTELPRVSQPRLRWQIERVIGPTVLAELQAAGLLPERFADEAGGSPRGNPDPPSQLEEAS